MNQKIEQTTEATKMEVTNLALADSPRPESAVATIGNSAESIMGIIATLSTNPSVDIDKIEKLMAIYNAAVDREESKIAKRLADEKERLFYIDFVKMKPKLPLVLRTKHNAHTKSNYAPLEEVNKTIDPILEQFGFATSAVVTEQTEIDVTMKLSVIHREGHAMTMTLKMPIDDKGPSGTKNKTTGQGIASTMTTAKRVGFCAMLNISTGDDKDGNGDDDDRHKMEFISPEEAIKIDLAIKEVGIDRAEFFKWAKTHNVDGEPVEDSRFILEMNLKKVWLVINERRAENKKKAAVGVK